MAGEKLHSVQGDTISEVCSREDAKCMGSRGGQRQDGHSSLSHFAFFCENDWPSFCHTMEQRRVGTACEKKEKIDFFSLLTS